MRVNTDYAIRKHSRAVPGYHKTFWGATQLLWLIKWILMLKPLGNADLGQQLPKLTLFRDPFLNGIICQLTQVNCEKFWDSSCNLWHIHVV